MMDTTPTPAASNRNFNGSLNLNYNPCTSQYNLNYLSRAITLGELNAGRSKYKASESAQLFADTAEKLKGVEFSGYHVFQHFLGYLSMLGHDTDTTCWTIYTQLIQYEPMRKSVNPVGVIEPFETLFNKVRNKHILDGNPFSNQQDIENYYEQKPLSIALELIIKKPHSSGVLKSKIFEISQLVNKSEFPTAEKISQYFPFIEIQVGNHPMTSIQEVSKMSDSPIPIANIKGASISPYINVGSICPDYCPAGI